MLDKRSSVQVVGDDAAMHFSLMQRARNHDASVMLDRLHAGEQATLASCLV
jgi:hypothetical protein